MTPVHIGFDSPHPPPTPPLTTAISTPIPAAPPSLPSSLHHHVLQVESRHRLVALAAFLRRQTLQAQRRGPSVR